MKYKTNYCPPHVKTIAVKATGVLMLSGIGAGDVGYDEYGRDTDEEQ